MNEDLPGHPGDESGRAVPPPPDEAGPDRAGPDDDLLADDPVMGGADGSGAHTALPPKVESWRRRSATGAILTGFAMGLQQALEVKRDEPAIMIETSGEPPKDLPVEADFEYGRPRRSVVNIRPWLLDDPAPAGPRLTTSGPDKGDDGADGGDDSRPAKGD